MTNQRNLRRGGPLRDRHGSKVFRQRVNRGEAVIDSMRTIVFFEH